MLDAAGEKCRQRLRSRRGAGEPNTCSVHAGGPLPHHKASPHPPTPGEKQVNQSENAVVQINTKELGSQWPHLPVSKIPEWGWDPVTHTG